MYITVHAAAGAAIGQFIPNPALAFVLGFASHIILDIIPHGDEWIKKWPWFKTHMQRTSVASFIDLIGVIIMASFWINHSNLNQIGGMLAGASGGVAPDALWGLYELTKSPVLFWYKKIHTHGHNLIFKTKLSMTQGFMIQLPLLALFTWIIIKY